MARLAGIELGGTKTIVVLGEPGRLAARHILATTTPEETLATAAAVLRAWQGEAPLDAVGVASFGPLRLRPDVPGFGHMLQTPKTGWSGADIVGAIAGTVDCPVSIDTDVNAAALAEFHHGAGRGCSIIVYLTIGTGVGGGIVAGDAPLHGRMHPEIGHQQFRRMAGDGFAGICPFHGDCIEGLVSGPALAARFGCHPATVAGGDARWNAPAEDLAQLLASLLLTVSPDRIIIGGGVAMKQPHLIATAAARVPDLLACYLPDVDAARINDIVCLPALGEDAGPLGAIEIGWRAIAV